MSDPSSAPQQPAPQQPAPPRPAAQHSPAQAAARRVGAGPVVMTVVGAVVLALAVVAGVLGTRQALEVLPVGVLSLDGSPGPDVLGVVDAPGELEIDLAGQQSYSLILTGPADSETPAREMLEADVTVLDPDGDVVRVRSAAVQMETTMGSTRAVSLAGFTTEEAGTYRVSVPATAGVVPAQVLVTEELPFGEFFSGLTGTIAAGVVATLFGIIGLGFLVGGVTWWVLARRPRAATAPGAATR